MRRRIGSVVGVILALMLGVLPPAGADHTDPRTPLAPTEGTPAPTLITRGMGTWTFIKNFAANPSTDLEFFRKDGKTYSSTGTLGQGDVDHVGQRMLRLTKPDGTVDPLWVADHGSAACSTNPSGTTGLQHDVQITPRQNPKLIIDTTDALERCHDEPGGGLEFIDISGIHQSSFKPREIGLTRHAGTSHTVTVDATRPWVVYNSSSDFSGRPWIDVLDIRTCLQLSGKTLAQKRSSCRPKVYRIPFEPNWSRQRDTDGNLVPGSEAACHDITARAGRIYCAALNATIIFDVSNLTTASGAIRGTPLNCTVTAGTRTGAKVTDCSGAGPGAPQRAQGWQFLGTFNHPGRTVGNTNTEVRSDQGIAVSHEADPSWDRKHMFVTDERGGGVVPPGSSCEPGIDNPYGNGGVHVFDIDDPTDIRYARKPGGAKAVWISDAIVPAATFCTVHVIHPVNNEKRFIVGYYTQGTKILDYAVGSNGRIHFRETASLVLPSANTWAVQQFKTVFHGDGTVTYFFLASDIERGIDIFKWRGPRNRTGASLLKSTGVAAGSSTGNMWLLASGLVLPAAALVRRRLPRRRWKTAPAAS